MQTGSDRDAFIMHVLSLFTYCMCDYLAGYILSLVLLTLPRQHLVKLYLYVLTALLLFAGHQVSRYAHTLSFTHTSRHGTMQLFYPLLLL